MVQFFPSAEESINYYNQKRCVDGKGLILPSQIVSVVECRACFGPEARAGSVCLGPWGVGVWSICRRG